MNGGNFSQNLRKTRKKSPPPPSRGTSSKAVEVQSQFNSSVLEQVTDSISELSTLGNSADDENIQSIRQAVRELWRYHVYSLSFSCRERKEEEKFNKLKYFFEFVFLFLSLSSFHSFLLFSSLRPFFSTALCLHISQFVSFCQICSTPLSLSF